MSDLDNSTFFSFGALVPLVLGTLSALLVTWLHSSKQSFKLPPGPQAWPIIGNLLQLGKEPHINLTEMARIHGKIFRIKFGSDLCVVLNDYDSIKKVLSHEGSAGRPKGTIIDYFTNGKGLIMSDGNIWKEHRRFALSTLRDLGMGKSWLQDQILDDVQQLLNKIAEEQAQPFDPEHLLLNSVSNIICAAVFGRRYDYDDATFRELLRMIRGSLENFGQANLLVLYPSLRFLPYFHQEFLRMKKEDDIFFEFIDKTIEEAKAAGEQREEMTSDYVNAFLREAQKQSTKADSTFDRQQLKISVANMFIAGMETTTSTILMGLVYMIENPAVMERIKIELDAVVGRDEMIRMDHRNAQVEFPGLLPYTEATLLELLRLHAVAPMGVFHRTTEVLKLDDYTLPKNTMIISNIYAVHRDPDLWTDPEAFDPSRFLDQDGNFVKSPFVIPFALGKRACLGENLALTELFLIFTNILRRFDIIQPPGTTLSSKNITVAVTINPKPYQLIFKDRL